MSLLHDLARKRFVPLAALAASGFGNVDLNT